MKLMFVRHGTAQSKNLGIPDEERQLTEFGRQELLEGAPYLAQYLKDKNVRLITSPLVRAVQTAEIFQAQGLPEAEVHEFAATGDLGGLQEAILDASGRLPVIFGHSPSLDEWIASITGQMIEMKKGAAALLDVTDEKSFKGHLIWYLPADKYRLLDRSGDEKDRFGKDVKDVVKRSLKAILDHRAACLKDPQETESVHKLRVKIRQFRSLLSFLKPLMPKKKYRTYQEGLRQMAQECAYLRELDVITLEWQSRRKEFEQQGASGDAFLEILRKERGAEQDRLTSYLKRPAFEKDLKRIGKKIGKAADPARTQSTALHDMVGKTLQQWHDEIRAGYEEIRGNELGIIHALRIRAKKMRYVMEVFGLDKDSTCASMYREIKTWQERLGNITDANRNTQAVHEIARHYPDEPIEEELRIFDEIQRQEAERLYRGFFQSRPGREDPKGNPVQGGH